MGQSGILDVDLLAFERGSAQSRAAVVDGVHRSLATGFVYTPANAAMSWTSRLPARLQ